METGRFEKTIKIGYTQGDRFAQMTPGYFLREAQQIAMEHCDALGFTVPVLLSRHLAFLLAKLELTIHRAPVEGETVVVKTGAQRPKRIVYKRVTRFESPEGELLAEIDSRWTLVDTVLRKITRTSPEGFADMMLEPEEDQGDVTIPRVECTAEERPVFVTYSMTDTNCHANNAFYADWVCDALAPMLIRGAKVRKLKLFYRREARAGETVQIRSAVADGVHYFAGDIPSGRCFDASVELTEPTVGEGEEAPLPYYI